MDVPNLGRVQQLLRRDDVGEMVDLQKYVTKPAKFGGIDLSNDDAKEAVKTSTLSRLQK